MAEGKVRLPVLEAAAEDGVSRRRFLALFGASAALATGAGCKAAQDRASIVPYTRKQEEIVPGVADFYASTFQHGEVAYPVLVKAREGRPIHVEGNDEDPRHRGKTSLQATADLLGLYDPDRLRRPFSDGRPVSWAEALDRLTAGLAAGKGAVLVTGAVLSPSRRALIARLQEAVPGLRHLEWEPAADHASQKAERALFGDVRATEYRFDRAEVVVALEADFLGTLADTVAAIAGFSSRRRPASAAEGMNRLYVVEGGLSLTGSRADVHMAMRPSALGRIAFGLVRAVHLRSGRPLPAGMDASVLDGCVLEQQPEVKPFAAELAALVQDLCAAGPRSLVVAGPAASPEAHAACLMLNHMLGAVGSTVLADDSLPGPALASPEQFAALVSDMAAGRVPVAIFWDGNPAYDHPEAGGASGDAWQAAIAKVPLRVRLGLLPDETAAGCNLVLPTNHWLESWNDFQNGRELFTLQQPVVAPLYDTLQGEDVLLRCLAGLGRPAAASYQAFLKQRWQDDVQPKGSPVPFAQFWHSCLHDGVFRRQAEAAPARTLDGGACAEAARQAARQAPVSDGFELVLDADLRLLDGRYANNGWLQEMPDPMTRVSWGNPLLLSLADADRLHLKNGDLVSLGRGPALPILRQPGQAPGVLRLALGYGHWQGSVAAQVGARAWTLAPAPGARVLSIAGVQASGGRQDLSLAQDHDTRDGRDIARLLNLAELASAGPRKPAELASLYDEHEQKGPRWGMAIDLSACVGCGACVVACQSENNIPVVGPEQVRKGRAMHWIRVDRYYESRGKPAGSAGSEPSREGLGTLPGSPGLSRGKAAGSAGSEPSREGLGTLPGSPGSGDMAAPAAIHEPMLCQHCDHAPCESVCPVQATNHGPDGINQMAYNRCVGTRYCANNCPYKVRRFNFLDFTSETPPSLQLAFNPEVSVRPRGVMEKCTFCVQRIRNAEQVAKREGRGLRDGDVTPACGAACPASAIVFGDISDPASKVSQLAQSSRGFRVLEELGTKPAITYLAALRNPAGKGKP